MEEQIVLMTDGQGNQVDEMCADIHGEGAYDEVMEIAESIIGDDAEEIVCSHSKQENMPTYYNQISTVLSQIIFTKSYLDKEDVKIGGVIGNSVGILSALYFAGFYSLEDCISLLHVRAKAFRDCIEQLGFKTGMNKLEIRPDMFQQAQELIEKTPGIGVALHNAPMIVNIGGKAEDLQGFDLFCQENAGDFNFPIARSMYLETVEASFHTHFFNYVEPILTSHLSTLSLQNPHATVFSGTSGKAETNKDDIARLLVKQAVCPERQVDAVNNSLELGFHNYLQVGPKQTSLKFLRMHLDDNCAYNGHHISLKKVSSDEVVERLAA